MPRRKPPTRPLSQAEVPPQLIERLQPPLAIVLGSPAEVANVLRAIPGVPATCFQFDLHQAEKLRGVLAEGGLTADVVTRPDLWDLPTEFQTALYLPAKGGERELKLDMVEQAYHVLRPRGVFAVWSPFEADSFFPKPLKETFGKVHTGPHVAGKGARPDTLLWCHRGEDAPRRRHEVSFQVKVNDGPSCRFLSRPGTFSYGRFDNGARAMCEVMEIEPGDRVLDLGCGVGTNGVFAAQQAGAQGHIAFVDSNVRAMALTNLNARSNGLTDFACHATATVTGPEDDSFDVVLANPPYFAYSAIGRLFIERARQLLTPQGKLYLVTRQPGEVAELVTASFGHVEAILHRGYVILTA